MTDLSCNAGASRAPLRLPFGLALFGAVGGAAALGLALGRMADISTAGWDAQLVTLLRFMAALKFAGVVAGAALVLWRAGTPMIPRTAGAYAAALATMALAPGLIWSLAHVALAAGLFHAGLLTFLVLAWRDTDGLEVALRSRRRAVNPLRPQREPTTPREGTTAQLSR